MPPSYNSSSSVMAPFFANCSCDPFTARDSQCILGTYVQYAVDVASADHVTKALDFAQRNNIRVVIRNTGHDYNGKSTGAGSLGIWMHHLKDIEIIDWSSDRYQGRAMRMGAGVQGFEAYKAAHEQNLAMVGGECPTVGLAGGYTQGGGHSMLGSKYGLGADQVLEWEVIDGKGNHLIATREQNTDLFWALSGGGGGTYGVVLSMTVKVYPDMPTSGFNLTFTSDGISQDLYWSLIGAWHELLPTIVDEGITGLEAFDNSSFTIVDLVGHGISTAKLTSLVSPFLATLTLTTSPTTPPPLSPHHTTPTSSTSSKRPPSSPSPSPSPSTAAASSHAQPFSTTTPPSHPPTAPSSATAAASPPSSSTSTPPSPATSTTPSTPRGEPTFSTRSSRRRGISPLRGSRWWRMRI